MNADPFHSFALHNPDSWTLECGFIEKLADRPIKNVPAFLLYCAGQRDLAAERGFTNARVRIQETIVRLQKKSES